MNQSAEFPRLRIVSLGGGGGSAQTLLAARPFFAERTAIIAVTDSGRSTGTARMIAGIPAPGDLRNVLATLAAEPNGPLARLMQYRLRSQALPLLDGMALGNLLLGGLAQMEGDLAAAVAAARQVLGCPEQILPVSTANTNLCAELDDGRLVVEEAAVRALGKPPIRRLFLDPPATAYPLALAAIAEADLVVIGPGSFYTSLMATLCFEGIVEALRSTPATVVFVVNTTTQPGQTDGMSIADHVARLVEALGSGVLDVALINDAGALHPATVARYAAAGLHPLNPTEADVMAIRALGVEPLIRDLAESDPGPRELWQKADTIRHDPQTLGLALWKIALDRARAG
ncbi:gluconeogenesis factor YvcK family protein [Chloroflexus sp.]|uniref:gluconeogenesis factor YvcK family protein n=1 Tax=Chloroflexus sp. TaxID=1904827 RepID=UPI0026086009|nr:gluconeogenesis factor YvcK family protein [uncultured Chloroflexus sp.]